jgi:hypothetical protein
MKMTNNATLKTWRTPAIVVVIVAGCLISLLTFGVPSRWTVDKARLVRQRLDRSLRTRGLCGAVAR